MQGRVADAAKMQRTRERILSSLGYDLRLHTPCKRDDGCSRDMTDTLFRGAVADFNQEDAHVHRYSAAAGTPKRYLSMPYT